MKSRHCSAGVGIVVGILDQLEEEVCRFRVKLIGEAICAWSEHRYARAIPTEHLQTKSLIETRYKYTLGDFIAVSLDSSGFP